MSQSRPNSLRNYKAARTRHHLCQLLRLELHSFRLPSASEPDNSLEWEDRKKHTIEHIKNSPLGSKLIVACDKISNLEDLEDCIELYGEEKSWSSLKRSKDKQKWYYTSLYESCINGVDKEHPIFKRYREILKRLFEY